MHDSKENFNEISTFIRLHCDNEHPRNTASWVYQIVVLFYENYNEIRSNHIKENIDFEILKTLLDKIDKNNRSVVYAQTLIDGMKNEYANHYNIPLNDAAVLSFAVPVSSFEITLSELTVMYKVLEYTVSYPVEINKFTVLDWSEDIRVIKIRELQDLIKERMCFALLDSY